MIVVVHVDVVAGIVVVGVTSRSRQRSRLEPTFFRRRVIVVVVVGARRSLNKDIFSSSSSLALDVVVKAGTPSFLK